jgi:hypothetical protein
MNNSGNYISLCYINAVALLLQVHGDSSRDGSTHQKAMEHRLPACVLFARCDVPG